MSNDKEKDNILLFDEGPWVREDIEPLTHITGNEYTMNWRTVWIGTERMAVRLRQHMGGIGIRTYIHGNPIDEEREITFIPDQTFGDTPDD